MKIKDLIKMPRNWQMGLIFIVGIILIEVFSRYDLLSGWVYQQLANVTEASVGLIIFYWAQRFAFQKRLHELEEEERSIRSRFIVVGIAIIVGAALI